MKAQLYLGTLVNCKIEEMKGGSPQKFARTLIVPEFVEAKALLKGMRSSSRLLDLCINLVSNVSCISPTCELLVRNETKYSGNFQIFMASASQ